MDESKQNEYGLFGFVLFHERKREIKTDNLRKQWRIK